MSFLLLTANGTYIFSMRQQVFVTAGIQFPLYSWFTKNAHKSMKEQELAHYTPMTSHTATISTNTAVLSS